jgi:hypothetical protein
MALIERVVGRDGEARRMLASAVEQSAGEQSAEAAALELELAADRYFAGDWPAIAAHAQAALTQAREHGDESLVAAAGAVLGFAITQTWKGNLASAAEWAEDAIDSAQLVGAEPLIELTFALRCWLAVRAGGLPEAISACVVLRGRADQDGGPHALLTRTLLGEALIENGDPKAGRHMILTAGAGPRLTAIELSQRPYLYELLTRSELATGAHAEAERWVRMAGDAATALDLSGPPALALRARAGLALAGGDARGAAKSAPGRVRRSPVAGTRGPRAACPGQACYPYRRPHPPLQPNPRCRRARRAHRP